MYQQWESFVINFTKQFELVIFQYIRSKNLVQLEVVRMKVIAVKREKCP